MKKIFLLSLCFIFLASALCFHACATGELTLSVGSVSGAAGDTVKVPITVGSNPGIIATKISINYDISILELQNAENGEIFADSGAVFGNDTGVSSYTMLWEDSLAAQDNTKAGVLVTLTFKILSDAKAGDTAVTLSIDGDSTFNYELENVPTKGSDGAVTISAAGQSDTVIDTSESKLDNSDVKPVESNEYIKMIVVAVAVLAVAAAVIALLIKSKKKTLK